MPIVLYQYPLLKTILAPESAILSQFSEVWKHDLVQQSCI